jgi:hypothetical protein
LEIINDSNKQIETELNVVEEKSFNKLIRLDQVKKSYQNFELIPDKGICIKRPPKADK